MTTTAIQIDASRSTHEQTAGPVFIVSMRRGGSSLLYALLNKHPQVALMYEADLLLLRRCFWKSRGHDDWRKRWQFWSESLSRHGFDRAEIPAHLNNFRDAFIAVHREYATRRGAVIWGDKSPNYYNRLVELAEEFHFARFIVVWRDPLATANAIKRAARAGSPYFAKRGMTLRSLLGYKKLKEQCDELRFRGREVHEVNYEDLVHDPSSTMRSLCGFLQIPYLAVLSNLEDADRSSIPPGEHHALLRGSVIVSKEREQLLDRTFRRKVIRYVNLWHMHYAGLWPPKPEPPDHDREVPGIPERILDKACYMALSAGESLTRWAFCFSPLSWLQRYRNLAEQRHRRRRQE
ncbi:MAG: sulfotransferase [Terriglobales bacterium]|jgi:hypothetical protein